MVASGKKTVEIRRTRPKCEVPFKCYIYETKDGKYANLEHCWGGGKSFEHAVGKVVGEFVCDQITEFDMPSPPNFKDCGNSLNLLLRLACLTKPEANEYLGDKRGFAWHISNLVIYDKPKNLQQFLTFKCNGKSKTCGECIEKPKCIKVIETAPQSYQFCIATEPRQTAD
jgi:predicted transcriptional regulator